VDVLTLTATPIPRTLYMSLTGARDMSRSDAAQDRLPVETIVAQNTDESCARRPARTQRGGQVFYLHNRVQTIELARERLRHVVPGPGSRSATARCPNTGWRRSCIVSSARSSMCYCARPSLKRRGHPHVNTILIDRADVLAWRTFTNCADAWGVQAPAYAYLLLPRHGRCSTRRVSASARSSAIEPRRRFQTRAARPEIRGAGNLLGAEQSGHNRRRRFRPYCLLLKRTIARLRGEQPPPLIDVKLRLDFIDLALAQPADAPTAVLPIAYLEDENLRVGAYRKLAAAATEAEIDELAANSATDSDLCRRRLIVCLKLLAADYRQRRGVQAIEVAGDKVMITRGGEFVMRGNHFPRLKAKDVQPADELIQLVRTLGT
jgi:transcription-repair coupling factor (superfamily II helicase)